MSNVYYWPFEFGRKTKANEQLQRILADYGYMTEADIDGIYGQGTKAAVEKVQAKYNLPVTGEIDRATEDLLFPGNYERRTPSMSDITKPEWLSKLTGNTVVNYLLTFVGGFIAAKFGLDPDLFRAELPNLFDAAVGVIGAITALIGAIRGITAAATPKVNVGGETVKLADMPVSAQQKVVAAVETATGKPVTGS